VKSLPDVKRGDLWTVSLPQQEGREQAGTRPAIVIQHDVYAALSPLVLVVSLTSRLTALRFPGTVRIAASESSGLSVDSVALVFQTRAVDR